ncbi:hypothetical protein F5890DRAFT_1595889 [Lentinula detonsa]|uniref:Uncharacterized protein n=1 Tax=Lentinula detonsa TaxID=2804962 RepID=A0AA38URL1_9AGAR|nr:hypothetical protein F5890DRAFT_1595889 [Lentinula detonsa]
MSTNTNADETIQQRRERLLQAQAARQRARKEEDARQEAEFAAEMARVKEEERRLAEEKRVAEEKQLEEEKRVAEEKRIAEERRRAEERLAEVNRMEQARLAAEKKKVKEEKLAAEGKRVAERRRQEELRRAEEIMAEAEDERVSSAAFSQLVEENRVKWEKAARELEKRQKRTATAPRPVTVVIPPRSSGSKKNYKSKSVISDDSDVEEREVMPAPRGEKQKRPIKMIAKGGHHSDPNGDFDLEQDDADPPLPSTNKSQKHPACSWCISIGRPNDCCPQLSRRQAQACVICHQQRQRCSWSGENASRQSRGKRVKLDDDEVYEGPAARVGERRFEGPGVAEQLAAIVGQNKDLINIACRSLVLQQRILHLMVRRERREEEAEKSEDEDEDGEGEDDEEAKEENDEEKRRKEVQEGKKRAD